MWGVKNGLNGVQEIMMHHEMEQHELQVPHVLVVEIIGNQKKEKSSNSVFCTLMPSNDDPS
jgi:hypothetical protein